VEHFSVTLNVKVKVIFDALQGSDFRWGVRSTCCAALSRDRALQTVKKTVIFVGLVFASLNAEYG